MKKPAHISDVVNELVKINQKVTGIKQCVEAESGIDYRSQDARHVALDGIQQNLIACGMWINGLLSLAGECGSPDSVEFREEDDFLKAVGSGLTLEQTEELMWNYLRLSLAVLVHFKIDNLFQNILKHIERTPTPRKRGFYHTSSKVLQAASISDTGYEKDVLTALANIRNSLHGNGIHKSPSMSVQIDGVDFEFKEGQKVECASWSHIATAILGSIDVLEKVLMSSNIKGITDEIKDEFSASV